MENLIAVKLCLCRVWSFVCCV